MTTTISWQELLNIKLTAYYRAKWDKPSPASLSHTEQEIISGEFEEIVDIIQDDDVDISEAVEALGDPADFEEFARRLEDLKFDANDIAAETLEKVVEDVLAFGVVKQGNGEPAAVWEGIDPSDIDVLFGVRKKPINVDAQIEKHADAWAAAREAVQAARHGQGEEGAINTTFGKRWMRCCTLLQQKKTLLQKGIFGIWFEQLPKKASVVVGSARATSLLGASTSK